jgi:hypothetical protein
MTHRQYYLDIRAALDPFRHRDDAFLSVPAGPDAPDAAGVAPNLSAAESRWQDLRFPVRLLLGPDHKRRQWQQGFPHHGGSDERAAWVKLIAKFEQEIVEVVDRYIVPVIILSPETTRWSVRVHGGPHGRDVSDRYRLTLRDPGPT